jgi:hypothetical protein
MFRIWRNIENLRALGYQCEAFIGWLKAKKPYPARERKGADLLVMGAWPPGLKD